VLGTCREPPFYLCLELAAAVRPLERLGEHGVEVADEGQHPRPQVIKRLEARPLEQTTHQDTEPDLHLVQPRAVFRRVHEANTVREVRQESGAALHAGQDAALALDAEVFFDAACVRDQSHQGL